MDGLPMDYLAFQNMIESDRIAIASDCRSNSTVRDNLMSDRPLVKIAGLSRYSNPV